MKLKNNKGITLISITVTVIILLAVTGIIIYNANGQVKIKKLNQLYTDIDSISAKVDEYYLKYGNLPILCDYLKKENVIKLLQKNATERDAKINYDEIINPNDGDDYYVIDLGKLEGLTITYGYNKEYQTIKSNQQIYSMGNLEAVEDEIYVINGVTHQIYFPYGIIVDGIIYFNSELSDKIETQEYKNTI